MEWRINLVTPMSISVQDPETHYVRGRGGGIRKITLYDCVRDTLGSICIILRTIYLE